MLQVVEWSTDPVSSASLFWNPGALSYLTQWLLASILTAYLFARARREGRNGRLQTPTLILSLLMLALSIAFLSSLTRLLTAGGWLSYVMPWSRLHSWTTLIMPWSRPFGGIASAALILLAYIFPQPLPQARREIRIVVSVLCVLIAMETLIAVRADIAIVSREVWWRPQWIAGWMSLGMIWAAIVFWRQFGAAVRSGAGGDRCQAKAHLWSHAPNREARVSRAFLILTLLPIIHTAALFLPDEREFSRLTFDIFIYWSCLIQLAGLTLVLIGYLPERSSFLFKLTVIGLTVLLAMVNGAAWMISPAYGSQFRAPGLPQSGTSLRFDPIGGLLGYAASPTVFVPERARGQIIGNDGAIIDLPFTLRFYERNYRQLYISRLGVIGFDRLPQPTDAAFENGVQPAIYPLMVDIPSSGTHITAFTDEKRLILTRRDRCLPSTASQCYQVQTIVYADGRIEMHYLDLPETPHFGLFNPIQAPWLMGITPGVSTKAGPPMLRDFYRAFLIHLDTLFAPLVLFTVVTTLAATIGLPVLFRSFLVEPLNRLLRGMRKFREGNYDTQVPVSFNDEIGYLIDSFNTMAREQTALTRGLEDRVADRVAEIADLTVNAAKIEERARLSADLHDAVAQSLASATLFANALPARIRQSGGIDVEAAEQVAELNRHALDEMRQLLTELRGDGPRTDGGGRLTELFEGFERLHGLDIRYQPSEAVQLPPEIFAIFYRVAQECLNNVVKHSSVRTVELAFEALKDQAMLMVRDEGCGFDPTEVDRRERLGLAIMRDRARKIGATLEIDTAPGQGCRVTMIWIR